MIEILKTLIANLPENSEELLNTLLEIAESDFLSYTNRREVPIQAQYLLCQMAVVLYNQRGNEGISSFNFSGISEDMINGYPSNIIAGLQRWRKLRLV